MSYQVLARKYRPQNFSDMVGQDHITQTLQNAISYERVGHAYIFVGTRGTGKTTIARIFAKALNCVTPVNNFEPCNKCQNCQGITEGSSLDVIEIDGASNNGVEDIRSLRENIQYSPATSKYKIYIIDEVHMLSNQAWNALLKTLEEPPKFVKFFFATTEAHKVLPTILSRCQRFDLKIISRSIIYQRLKQIIEYEKVNFTVESLQAIARAANGGMRDALSMLDQMIAFCCKKEEPIDEDDVSHIFGLASSKSILDIISAMIGNEPNKIIIAVDSMISSGKNIDNLYQNILEYLRQMMIYNISPEQAVEILKIDQEELQMISKKVQGVPASILRSLVDGFIESESMLRYTLNKRIFFEVLLLRITQQSHSISIDTLVNQLNHLRQSEPDSLINMPIIEKKKGLTVPVLKIDSGENNIAGLTDKATIGEKVVEPYLEKLVSVESSIPVQAISVIEEDSAQVEESIIGESTKTSIQDFPKVMEDDNDLVIPNAQEDKQDFEITKESVYQKTSSIKSELPLEIISLNSTPIIFEDDERVLSNDPLKIIPQFKQITDGQKKSSLNRDKFFNDEKKSSLLPEVQKVYSEVIALVEEEPKCFVKEDEDSMQKYDEDGQEISQEILNHPVTQEIFQQLDGKIYHIENK